MNIKLGWSGEIHGTWTKMDVEVEEIDFTQHLIQSGARDVEELKFSTTEKFKLMYSIGEIFVHLHKMSRFPEVFSTPETQKELKDLLSTRDELTKKILESQAPF